VAKEDDDNDSKRGVRESITVKRKAADMETVFIRSSGDEDNNKNKATEIDSLMPGSYYFRAKINYIEYYYNAALEEITTAIKLADDKDYYYVLRAKIYIYNDNEDDDELAIEDLNKAIKLGSKEAKELLLEHF
jgi:tetratricopeptide (TPR) repeat protein